MLWGLACVSALNPPPLKVTGNLSDYLADLKPPDCVGLLGNSYKMVYSCTMSYEAAILGSVSLLLAILNIICIFFMGVIVMKVKELSPLPGATKGSVTFWKKDVPIMRHTYETIKGPKSLDMRRMAKELVKEIKQKNPVGWENIVKDVKDDPLWKDLNTGLEPKQDILQVMTEKNNDDDDFDQPKSNHFNRQPGGAFSSEHTEILLNDQRYQTISGNIAPFRAHIRDLFSNQDEESAGDLSQSASVATTPTASKMPIGGGGCIVRMRRTHHKGRPKSANDRKYSDSQALSYHNNNVSFVNGSSTAQQQAAEDEEEEDEVLMLNYNKIAHFKKNAYNKKRATSIAYGASERSPGSTHAASCTPSRMQQVRIRIDEGQNQTFNRDNSMT
ncbi:hypothetical protein HELRODRAFT_188326 [Helobdella robusta]|uniref:Uncharacterized protein n=1 Tax=Helobdella robusta TaxID=6412 RepID=T1FPV9_HELRO|nr:hypothetical protein HELRODRAFT_188326 [Helobdella robusta]ESO06315.1 hypothetical protein HELRODRAFT_188326 [Helobdella robusta]